MIDDPETLAKLREMRCPDCGGRLLKGPRGGAGRNVTCGSCAEKFNLIGIASGIGFTFAAERLGKDAMQAHYHDPTFPKRQCDYCDMAYTGPAVYCSFGCALEDAL
jgi:DNA-directed RNA polymerase subunit RPC12/RpoP